MLERVEVEFALSSPSANFDIVALVVSIGHVGIGRIRDRHKRFVQPSSRDRSLPFELPGVILELRDKASKSLEVILFTLGFRFADPAGDRVSLGGCGFRLVDLLAHFRIDAEQFLGHRFNSPTRKALIEFRRVVPYFSNVVHF